MAYAEPFDSGKENGGEAMLRISISCNDCGKMVTIEAHKKDFLAWRDGTLIQNALPYLSRDQREMLMTRTCGECFDRLFPREQP